MKQTLKNLILFLAIFAGSAVALDERPASPTQKAVLITGASSGLGRAMAELIASRGHFVYAGARSAKDLAELDAVENIQAIRLDVTVQEDIAAAVRTVRDAGRGLYGLINNAGVAVALPLIEISEEDFDFQMEVNVYGPYRVTRAFAPLIIESRGRIVTTGSISGILAGPLSGAYSMSKHAIEAFTDSLAAEMARFAVHVSVLEPGTYESEIGANMLRRLESRGLNLEDSRYSDELDRLIEQLQSSGPSRGDPLEVAETAHRALFEENPQRRYMIVPNERQAEITVRTAIGKAVQLNHGQEFSFDRERLVEMLDDALAARH